MPASKNFCRRTRREFLWEARAGFTGLVITGLLISLTLFGCGPGQDDSPAKPRQAPHASPQPLPEAHAAYQRGRQALDRQEYDQAISDFTEAIRLDPKSSL